MTVHVLDLQLVAIVRTAAVVQVKNVGQALLFCSPRDRCPSLIGAIRTSAFASVVNPAHEVS